MKKLMIAALCASSMMTVAMPAPAMAATPSQQMIDMCNGYVVTLNGNAGWLATPIESSISETTAAPVRSVVATLVNIPGGQFVSAVGPTYVPGSQGRNGQSPNIFGSFKTVTEYTGGTTTVVARYTTVTTHSFRCLVYKIAGNNNVPAPNGLQPGAMSYTTSASEDREETVSNPNYFLTSFSEAVICNSPTRNPGVWRAQNGYTGTCSTALFNSLSQIAIHSNSLPPLEYLTVPGANDPVPQDYADEPGVFELDPAEEEI